MLGTHDLPLFVVSCILLNLTPGQDTVFVLGRTLAHGRTAGIFSTFGIMSGVLIHTSLAAVGLSAILATSALAFNIVKYAGAVYLVWIGFGFLTNTGSADKQKSVKLENPGNWTLFRQGLFTNILNPKVSLFFLSFLPQFVAPHSGSIVVSFALLGMIFFTTGSVWCLVLVGTSAWLSERLKYQKSIGGLLKKLAGTLFVGLGIKLALSHVE